MGDLRTFVTFEASLPDDAVFAESGDVSVPSGRNICEVLIANMQSEGIVASDAEQHESYGWEFTAKIDGAEVRILVQWVEPWLMILENRSGRSGVFRRAREPSASSMNLIHDVLKQVMEISNISWFTRGEFESGSRVGNPNP